MKRFWKKVCVKDDDDCWLWLANQRCGYGLFRVRGWSKHCQAPRFAWMIHTGLPIPLGLEVMHTCDNSLCCNPSHLQIGTHAQNMAQMKERDRQAYGSLNGRTSLTEDDVRAIINDERVQREIAGDYEIHHSQVSRMKAGKTWKHLH